MTQSETSACPELVDVGANLTHDSFAPDLEPVLARAAAVGVRQIVVTGASRAGTEQAVELASRYSQLFATAGNHPHHAGEHNDALQADLAHWASHPQVRAIGETGLDYFRDIAPRPQQRRAFEMQLALAVECGKPVFLHQRDAHADFFAILRDWRDRLGRAVVHCFTDQREALFDYLDMDLYVGITGWICDERRGQHLAELVPNIPAGRLLIETDSPYLLPRDLRPKPASRRNEPFHLAHIAAVIAGYRGESPAALAAHTTAAARRFFDLPAPNLT